MNTAILRTSCGDNSPYSPHDQAISPQTENPARRSRIPNSVTAEIAEIAETSEEKAEGADKRWPGEAPEPPRRNPIRNISSGKPDRCGCADKILLLLDAR